MLTVELFFPKKDIVKGSPPTKRLSAHLLSATFEKVKQWVNEQSFLIFGKNEVPLTKALFLQRAYKIIFLLILSGIAERPLAFYPTLLKINYLFSNLLFFGGVLWMIKVVRDQSYSSSHPCQPLISETYIPQNNIGISPSAQKSLLPASVIDEKPFLTTPPIIEQKPLLPAPIAKVVPSTKKPLASPVKEKVLSPEIEEPKAEITEVKKLVTQLKAETAEAEKRAARIEAKDARIEAKDAQIKAEIAELKKEFNRIKQIILENLSNRQSSKKRPTPSA